MSALIILISASLFVALLFLFAFIWATKKGQFDDDYTPSVRILFEENTLSINNENLKHSRSLSGQSDFTEKENQTK